MSKIYVVNEVYSDGFSEGNESYPYVYKEYERAIDRAYESYKTLWMDYFDYTEEDTDDNGNAFMNREMFGKAYDLNVDKFYVLIQGSCSHAQIEIYETKIR